MMSARDSILARIRTRLGKPSAASPAERAAVLAHIGEHPRSAAPATAADPVARFRQRAEGLASTVDEVEGLARAPAAVARYLDARGLPRAAICWADLSALDWAGAGMQVEARAARDGDLIGITGAYCAIAETGTLVCVSGPRAPAAASLLPETHIAVISAARVVPDMEEAWALLRAELRQPPRAVSFISGPSRTADIEQTVTLGAHGPYRVHVILVR